MSSKRLKRFIVATLVIGLIGSVSLAQKANAIPQARRPAAQQPKRSAAKTALVDINSATKQELIALPGIDDTLAQKIIDGRPYRTKTQLRSRKIVPDSTYSNIAGKVVAKQSKK